MKFVHKLAIVLLLCELIVLKWSWALPSPQVTKEDEEGEEPSDEEDEEDTDDVYDEEDAASNSTTNAPEEETPDPDELEDARNRKKIADRLGVKNFSGAALAERATGLVWAYLAAQGAQLPTQAPKKRVRPTLEPIPETTVKYEIKRTTTDPAEIIVLPASLLPVAPENLTGQVRTFTIKVPNGMNGTGESVIEINIPMMTPKNNSGETGDNSHHSSQMAITGTDEQGVKNIEAAIMEALIIAQQMASMSMSSSSSNGTDFFELDIGDLSPAQEEKTDNEKEETVVVTTNSTSTSSPPLPQKEVSPPEVTSESPSTKQPPRKRRPSNVSTTPRGPIPGDSLGVGPVTSLVVSQIRNGQLPSFLWKSVMKLANSVYGEIAVDAVECAVFYYCPDDTELGTLSNKSKF